MSAILEYAEWLRAMMKKYEINSVEFAKMIGVSRDTVKAWRIGSRLPSKKNQRRIKAAFNKLEQTASALPPPEPETKTVIINKGVSPVWMYISVGLLIAVLIAYTYPHKSTKQASVIPEPINQEQVISVQPESATVVYRTAKEIETSVYIANNPSVYHLSTECPYIKGKSVREIPLSDAKDNKYPLCSYCERHKDDYDQGTD